MHWKHFFLMVDGWGESLCSVAINSVMMDVMLEDYGNSGVCSVSMKSSFRIIFNLDGPCHLLQYLFEYPGIFFGVFSFAIFSA